MYIYNYILQHYVKIINVTVFLKNCKYFDTNFSSSWLHLEYAVDPE